LAADDNWLSTLTLLTRARAGDESALNDLFARYLPGLARWASRRLPPWARQLSDTHDLVQDALVRTFKKVDGFEHRGEGAFLAYLRQVVMNRIRDEIRSAKRLPPQAELDSEIPDPQESPLQQAVGAEALERYEKALAEVSAGERELIIARVELGLSYREIAEIAGKPSPDAARMAVSRAIAGLAKRMQRLNRTGPASSDSEEDGR